MRSKGRANVQRISNLQLLAKPNKKKPKKMAASQQADAIKPNEQSKVEPIAEEENKSEESTVISTALSKAVTEEESKDKG